MTIDFDTARMWYPEGDAVHGFDHVLRVYKLAERISLAEGADWEIVRAAVLLHDAQDDQTSEQDEAARLNHHHASAAFAGRVLRQIGWDDTQIARVQHCVRAHRFRDDSEQPQSLEAKVLFDADKLDAIGAIGAARAVAYAACHGMPAYADVSQQFIETGILKDGELHSAYHEYLFKLRKLKDRLYTPTAKEIGSERHRFMEAYFERLAQEVEGGI